MSDTTKEVGALFVDVSDSTKLYRTLGDDRANAVILECLDRLAEIVAIYKGEVVERIGDELFCTFPSLENTASAATDMQLLVGEYRLESKDTRTMAIRIGFHFGSVVERDGSVFGDTVHVAQRLSTIAKREQIAVADETREYLGNRMAMAFRPIDRLTLKGQSTPTDVFELLYDACDATLVGPQFNLATQETHSGDLKHVELVIRSGDKEAVVSDSNTTLTIGRGSSCDFVLDSKSISRLHGRLEKKKTRFIYFDLSTNGTCVTDSEGTKKNFLRRDDRPLPDSGSLYLGVSEPKETACRIDFETRTLDSDE